MKKLLLAAAMLAVSASAHADDGFSKAMDTYMACWGKVVTTLSIDKPGPAKYREANRLTHLADKVCGPQSDVAAKVDGLQAVKDTRQYMEVQFYNGNFQMDQ